MAMLKGDSQYILKFQQDWTRQVKNSNIIPIYDSPTIVYSYADFDEQVLQPVDIKLINDWLIEIGIKASDGIAEFREIVKIKKNPYKKLNDKQLKFFNRVSWLSLGRKGEILLESFRIQFYPKIKTVHATQKFTNIKDPNSGDSITGVIDCVLEIEGYDKPIIFDLKTASQPYKQEQIELTDQLTLYAALEAAAYNTDLVGYIVLSKNIPKVITSSCSKCGAAKDGRHKTCNNKVGAVRCNGAWVEKKVLSPEVQVLVEKKSPEQMNALLVDYDNIISAMKQNIVYKNFNKCNNWFGGPCPFKNFCHKNGDMTGLKKRG